MDFNKLKAEFNKLIKQKNFSYLLIGVLILGFMLIAINVISPRLVNLLGGSRQITQNNKEEKDVISTEANTYEAKEKQELISILEQIEGVGKVDVKISYESGEAKEIAYDQNSQVTKNEETDIQGGKRVTDGKTDGSKVVMSNNSGNSEPIIIKTLSPKVRSVFIVAEGAGGSKIKYELQKAVANLFDLTLDKVNVYPMK